MDGEFPAAPAEGEWDASSLGFVSALVFLGGTLTDVCFRCILLLGYNCRDATVCSAIILGNYLFA